MVCCGLACNVQLDAKELELSDLKEQVQEAQQGVEAQLSQVCAAGCVDEGVGLHQGVGTRGGQEGVVIKELRDSCHWCMSRVFAAGCSDA